MGPLIEAYDAALFDLDGVIYLGPVAVPGAVDALASLRAAGVRVMYVTNNAARPAQVVIDQLNGLGIAADADSVLTSAQVAASALAQEWPAGTTALVSGSQNLASLLAEAGFQIVHGAADHPALVIQGYDPDLSWRQLDEATLAIQSGARWYATNADASRPTERGLVPGVGGAIAVIATALDQQPTVFGKPHRPMLLEAVRRTNAAHAIFVGDRLDTDISGAAAAGLDSLFVFSGAHGKWDLTRHDAPHPSYIGSDVGALLQPARVAVISEGRAVCRAQTATIVGGTVRLETTPQGDEAELDALWAITQLLWSHPGVNVTEAVAGLERLA